MSQPQADLANQRIAAAGLGDRCRVLVKPGDGGKSGLPLTRADWYAEGAPA